MLDGSDGPSNMPMMNGPDACREIRKLGYKLPIFGVTGDTDVEVFIRAGANGVMLKPVKADALLIRCVPCLVWCVFGRRGPSPPRP